MKELLQTILTTSKERVSNPIIGTFILSWLAFNWRPLIFIFFANQKIEDKIKYIDSNFSNISNLLYFPLITMVVYVLIIPYLNLIFEFLLEYSRIKRNFISISKQKQLIENKKELAIEEIKLEEAQTEFKERKNQNKLIEDLNKSIIAKEDQLNIERERFNDLNRKIKDESSYLNKRFNEDKKEFDEKMKLLINENESLRQNLYEMERNFNVNRKILENESIRRDENGLFYLSENGRKNRLDNISEKEIKQLKEKGLL